MPINPRAEAILAYWQDLGPEGWYAGGEALDREIRSRFEGDWNTAAQGGNSDWMHCPEGMLAYLILTDQFPRNMFRGSGKAFSTDPLARRVAHYAWQNGADLRIDEPIRQFFYLPLEHSENPFDQDRSVALVKARMVEAGIDRIYGRGLPMDGPIVDFAVAARAHGAHGALATTADELRRAVASRAPDVPLVIDVRIDPGASFPVNARVAEISNFASD